MSVCLNLLLLLCTVTAAWKSNASRCVLRRAAESGGRFGAVLGLWYCTVMARWMGDAGPPRSLRCRISWVLYRLALWIGFEGAEEGVRGKRFDH